MVAKTLEGGNSARADGERAVDGRCNILGQPKLGHYHINASMASSMFPPGGYHTPPDEQDRTWVSAARNAIP